MPLFLDSESRARPPLGSCLQSLLVGYRDQRWCPKDEADDLNSTLHWWSVGSSLIQPYSCGRYWASGHCDKISNITNLKEESMFWLMVSVGGVLVLLPWVCLWGAPDGGEQVVEQDAHGTWDAKGSKQEVHVCVVTYCLHQALLPRGSTMF